MVRFRGMSEYRAWQHALEHPIAPEVIEAAEALRLRLDRTLTPERPTLQELWDEANAVRDLITANGGGALVWSEWIRRVFEELAQRRKLRDP